MRAEFATTLIISTVGVSAQGDNGGPPRDPFGPPDFNPNGPPGPNSFGSPPQYNPIPGPWGPSHTHVVEYVECSLTAQPTSVTVTEDVTVTACPHCMHEPTMEHPGNSQRSFVREALGHPNIPKFTQQSTRIQT